MFKHLLILIVPLTLLANCNGDFWGWEHCCDVPPGAYCLADECNPGDEGGGRAVCEGLTTYYVYITPDCGKFQESFCAADQASADALADSNWPGFHGPVVTDPTAGFPTEVNVCATGPECVIGSSDGSYVTTFWSSSVEQTELCEGNLDPNCSWTPAVLDVDNKLVCPPSG